MVTSSELALIQKINEKFEKPNLIEQGDIAYMKIALNEIVYMTQDVATALQEWIKTTSQDGMTKFPGENVSALKALINAVFRLPSV